MPNCWSLKVTIVITLSGLGVSLRETETIWLCGFVVATLPCVVTSNAVIILRFLPVVGVDYALNFSRLGTLAPFLLAVLFAVVLLTLQPLQSKLKMQHSHSFHYTRFSFPLFLRPLFIVLLSASFG